MKKILVLFLCIALTVLSFASLTACGDKDKGDGGNADTNGENNESNGAGEVCTEHYDADGDGICNLCNENMPDDEIFSGVSVTFTLKDDEGNVVPGVSVILNSYTSDDYNVTTAKSDENGQIKAQVNTGEYYVTYEYNSDDVGYYEGDTTELSISMGTENVTLYLINTTPNGTVTRPYPISAIDTSVTVPANSSVHYIIYHTKDLYFVLEGADVSVIRKEGTTVTTHEPDGEGKLRIDLIGENVNSVATVIITNNSSEEATYAIEINSNPGTYGNPIVITDLSAIAEGTVSSEKSYYYIYTATATGTLTINMTSEDTLISAMNLTNSCVDDADDDGVITIEVTEGDEVRITCATSSLVEIPVSFTAELA